MDPTTELELRIYGIVLASSCILASAQVLLSSLEREVVERGGWLVSQRGRWRTSAVALDNIREIQLRETGSAWGMGMDQGVGLVLYRPRYINVFGWTSRFMPRMNYLLGKSHTGFSELYEESPQVIAARIAAMASEARGVPVPICNFGLRGASTLEARPVEPIVPTGVRCAICGYELRLLPRDGICPECGTAVRRSLERRSQLDGDERWISDLRWGSLALVLSGFMWITAAMFSTHVLTSALQGSWMPNLAAQIVRGPFLAASGFLLIGAWLYTSSPKGAMEQAGKPWPRSASRIALAIPVLTLVLVYSNIWSRRFGLVVWMWAGSVILGFLMWYSVHLLGRMGRPFWRYLAVMATLMMMMIATSPALEMLLDGLKQVFPGLAAAVTPKPSQPTLATRAQAMRILPSLIAMLVTTFVGSWTAVFAAVWWTLRQPVVSEADSPPT